MLRSYRSSSSSLVVRCIAALMFTVSAGTPVLAQGYLGQDPALLAQYRCSVLGETSQCAAVQPKASPRIEERVVLGPRAKYLVYLGVDPVAAVSQARLAGEVPVRETVRITTRTLSSAEKFDRANGRTTAPEQIVEVLSTTPILVDADVLSPRS
jgi:hypothetical protein